MRLHSNPASPFVRKVLVLLKETGQEADVTLVPAAGHAVAPGTMPVAQNPLGKIPTLERDSGPALYDSRVICRFLDDRAGGKLYPAAPRLWDTLTLEATADGIMDAAVLMRYETTVRPEAAQFAPWIEGQWEKIARALDTIEARWMSHLSGPMDMGQIAVACALGYLDLRHPGRDWRAPRPALSAWYAAILTRPSLAETIPA
ncbi:glutathione S-transferase [Solirhodobacter olei]|uniref:glutathione S-transferase n=1 Tax=Solirhodobacter olei TaxID=2493082 RepID=UPI000FD9FAC0|nr:glutathione S-transferase [Solirhodobacter olei]